MEPDTEATTTSVKPSESTSSAAKTAVVSDVRLACNSGPESVSVLPHCGKPTMRAPLLAAT
ncbi:MAG: hypothetical protein ACI855_001568, partial [Myxococcota bacterium]